MSYITTSGPTSLDYVCRMIQVSRPTSLDYVGAAKPMQWADDLLAQRNELLAVLIAIAHEINGARSCDTGSYLPQQLEDRIFEVIDKVMEATE